MVYHSPPWKRLHFDPRHHSTSLFGLSSSTPLILLWSYTWLGFIFYSRHIFFSWLYTVWASPLDFFGLVFHLTSLPWLFGFLLFNNFYFLRHHHSKYTIHSSLHASITVSVASSLARPLITLILHTRCRCLLRSPLVLDFLHARTSLPEYTLSRFVSFRHHTHLQHITWL